MLTSSKILLFLLIFSTSANLLYGNILQDSKVHLTIFVSSSEGNDNNDGLTECRPLRTIRKAVQKRKTNIRLRLKCGDVFFESISGLTNSMVESYGKGNKPILCGFKILKDSMTWQADTIKGLWKLDLSKEDNFCGFSIKDASDKAHFNNIGFLYDAKQDKIYGCMKNKKNKLENEGYFFTSCHYGKDATFKYIYFKWDRNPKELGNVCFSTYNHGIYSMKSCVIRNIAIIGFARHGIVGITDTKVDNCNIDAIGGSIQIGFRYWVRYGNGIECGFSKYNKTKDITVSNCRISRTYDCGVTIQGTVVNDNNPCRIRFINNKFIYCRQAFEHWITNKKSPEPDYIDCEFSKNICYMMGKNQFDSPETRDANILSYEKTNKSLKIADNIFYGASYYCGYAFASIKNNRVYIYKGQYLNTYHGKKDYPTIYANDSRDIETYRQLTQDNSRIFILEKGSKEDLCFHKKILKKISFKSRNILLK